MSGASVPPTASPASPASRGRWGTTLLLGGLSGILLLAIALLPFSVARLQSGLQDAVRSENLVPASGVSEFDDGSVEVEVLALMDGAPLAGLAVSADGQAWYTPDGSGRLCLSLPPGSYSFSAAYANRQVNQDYRVAAGAKNRVSLDLADAPAAPELIIFDAPADTDSNLPLGIDAGSTVVADEIPNGFMALREADGYVLSLRASFARPGFYPVALRISNGRGEATAHVGVRIPSDQPPTVIRSLHDLQLMRENPGGSYRLESDLDLSGITDWQPLFSAERPFTGAFDGGGHVIRGFRSPEHIVDGTNFSFFGYLDGAELHSLVFREPQLMPQVPPRESGVCFDTSVVLNYAVLSYIYDIAVIGGVVAPSDGLAAGIGSVSGIATGLFNSASVTCSMAKRWLPNTGGLLTAVYEYSYMERCANEGDVKGNHVTGGIAGFTRRGEIVRSVNSGTVWGLPLVGEFPAGGIAQSTDWGRIDRCYFVRGTSAVGARVFSSPGITSALVPIQGSELRDSTRLAALGRFEHDPQPLAGGSEPDSQPLTDGSEPDWAFAALDAKGPVPYGIFRQAAPAPLAQLQGDRLVFPEVSGVVYFYTTDGSDPRLAAAQKAGSLAVRLSEAESLLVFAARQGCRDSAVVSGVQALQALEDLEDFSEDGDGDEDGEGGGRL